MPRIQLKLMGALALLVLAVVGTMGFLAERGLRERELARIERGLEQRARLVRQLLRDGLTDSPEALAALAEQAGTAARARVTLIDPDGRVVGDSEVASGALPGMENHGNRPEVLEARNGRVGSSTRTSATVRRPMLYLALPPDAQARGRIVRLAVDLEEVEAATAELRRVLMLAGALGLFGALVLSFAIARYTLQPIEELRRVVTDIADGKLDTRLRLSAKDELGEIAGSINRVAQQLRNRLDETAAEKKRLEAVLGSMVEGVLVLDAGGHITLANPRLQELLGAWFDPHGKTPLDLIRNEAAHQALIDAATTEGFQVLELQVGPRTLLMHATAVPPVGQGGCVAVFHDVSEIRRVDQIRRDFLANASHELRTPLTSIRGYAATLLEGEPSPEQRQKFLEVISRNAERLSNLIDDLLELSQIEGRREPLHASEVEIEHVVRTLLDDLAPRLAQRGITAAVDSDGPTRVWADRRAVEQILTNLIDNALKYSDEGGRIDVTLLRSGGGIQACVADEGIGIPEDEIDRVFERFYRVDKARSRALGGTGLGLAIVKHLVQASNGTIRVESSVGEGSRFTFWLPSDPPASDDRA